MEQGRQEKNVLIWIGVCIVVLSFLYFTAVTFLTIPKDNRENMNLILGYISSIVSLISGFYWGNSNKTIPPIDPNKSITIPTQGDNTNTALSINTTQNTQPTSTDQNLELDYEDLTPPVKG